MSVAALIAPALLGFGLPLRRNLARHGGRAIGAHGDGFLLDGGTYYWYGSARNGLDPPCCKDRGINLYSSKDLYNWRHEGLVLAAFNGSLPTRNGLDLERPKTIKCAATGEYVMWVRGTGDGNTPQLLGVATAPHPAGPFSWVGNASDPFRTVAPGNPNMPEGYQYADATLFQDPRTGKAYVYWRTRVNPQNTGFRAMQLTSDCRDVVPSSDAQLFQTPNREAPAIFYANARFYLWTSGCDGWAPTTTHVYTATEPLGCFNCSGLNNSKGWLIGWEPPPIPAPRPRGTRSPRSPASGRTAAEHLRPAEPDLHRRLAPGALYVHGRPLDAERQRVVRDVRPGSRSSSTRRTRRACASCGTRAGGWTMRRRHLAVS